MRRVGACLAISAAICLFAASPAAAETVTRTVDVRMPRLAVGTVVTIEGTKAMVNFGAPFDSIESICFHVVMEGDVLEPDLVDPAFGDTISLEPLGGFTNATTEPIAEFTLCLHPVTFHVFLDGHERILVQMEDQIFDHDDTARIVELTATIVGER